MKKASTLVALLTLLFLLTAGSPVSWASSNLYTPATQCPPNSGSYYNGRYWIWVYYDQHIKYTRVNVPFERGIDDDSSISGLLPVFNGSALIESLEWTSPPPNIVATTVNAFPASEDQYSAANAPPR
jgi:hypothetical protein